MYLCVSEARKWINMLCARMPFSRLREQTCVSYVSCIGSGFFTTSTTWEAQYAL